jgi:hypothetical protein
MFIFSCRSKDGDPYSFSQCTPDASKLPSKVYVTYNNTFFAPNATFALECSKTLSLPEWQQLGQDAGRCDGKKRKTKKT